MEVAAWVAAGISALGAVLSFMSAGRARQAAASAARRTAELADVDRRRGELTAAFETVVSAFDRWDADKGRDHLDVLLLGGLERLEACDAADTALLSAVARLRDGLLGGRDDVGLGGLRAAFRACRDDLTQEHKSILATMTKG